MLIKVRKNGEVVFQIKNHLDGSTFYENVFGLRDRSGRKENLIRF